MNNNKAGRPGTQFGDSKVTDGDPFGDSVIFGAIYLFLTVAVHSFYFSSTAPSYSISG